MQFSISRFALFHVAGWVLLYLAFGQENEGAVNVLKVLVWVAAISCLALLWDSEIEKSVAKRRPSPILVRMLARAQACVALGGLYALGHFLTAAALAFFILVALFFYGRVETLRAMSTSGARNPQ
jgi:divalent metal cation (Fe/Co/Zn/Cd) transporter